MTALDQGCSDLFELLTAKDKNENLYASSNSLLSSLYHERMARQAPNRITATIRAPGTGRSSESTGTVTGGGGVALPLMAAAETGANDWRVELMQRPGAQLGAHVWESAYTLCDFMRAHLVDLAGLLSSITDAETSSAALHSSSSSLTASKITGPLTVIELGSGCGLGGVVAARILDGAIRNGSVRIVLTDQAPLVPLLRDTVALQPLSVHHGQSSCMRVVDFDWGEDAHALLRRVPSLFGASSNQVAEQLSATSKEPSSAPLLVIAADIVYHPASVPLLIQTVLRLGGASASGADSAGACAAVPVMQCLCLAYRRRHAPTEQPFFDALPADWRIWMWTESDGGDSTSTPLKEQTHPTVSAACSARLESSTADERPTFHDKSNICRACRLLSPHRGFQRVFGARVHVERLPLRPVLFVIAAAGGGLAQCACSP